jgi:hypothetical protein
MPVHNLICRLRHIFQRQQCREQKETRMPSTKSLVNRKAEEEWNACSIYSTKQEKMLEVGHSNTKMKPGEPPDPRRLFRRRKVESEEEVSDRNGGRVRASKFVVRKMVKVIPIRIVPPGFEFHTVRLRLQLIEHPKRTVEICHVLALQAPKIGQQNASDRPMGDQ